MSDVIALKRQAVDQKHLLEHYFTLFEAFQNYVEKLTPFILGNPANQEMLVAAERFRLLFAEHESDFEEWHEGYRVINEAIAVFVNNPDEFKDNQSAFRIALSLATTKFEILIKMAARDLKELHEHIAVVEGQEKAEKVTGVPASALNQLKELDTALEIGKKWLGRAIQFTPWVYEVMKQLGQR
jgi:hypothetical protein